MSIFFDQTYYLQNNPDVLAAVARGETTAEQHFNTFGWQEGRNPNATFDVNFYLLDNLDVLAAGVNPLTHFIQFGAAEGRSPSESFVTSADFDTKTYAANNPDLAAAGVKTPAQLYAHFATYGFAENRPGVQTIDGTPIEGGVPGGPVGTTFTLTSDLDQFTGTDANDVFQGVSTNLNAFDKIDGGAGTDTMNLVGNLPGSFPGVSISKVEIVNITDNSNTVDAAVFGTSVQQIWQIDNSGVVENVGDTTTVGFRGNLGVGDVEFTGTVGNVALDNVDDGFGLWSYGEITTLNISGSLEQDSDPAVVEELVLHDHTDDNSIETLNLSLSTGTKVNALSSEFESLATFDASDSTGGIKALFDVSSGDLENLEAVVLGSGSDDVEVNFWDAGVSSLATVNLGAGDDTLKFSDTGFSGVMATLGAGKDQVTFAAQLSNIQDADEAAFEDDVISITDFSAGDDVLDISAAVGARVTLTNVQEALVSAADSLFDAVAVVAGAVGLGNFATFQFSDSTYIFAENGPEGFNTNDGLVELTGFTGSLTDANFVFV